MKFDPSIQAAGQQCGIDVESLYKKYSQGGAPKNGEPNSNQDSSVDSSSTTDGLDSIRICKRCHGYGLVKELYNHQVKEVNCEECRGEGTVEIKQE